MTSETKVWLWCAFLMRVEADSVAYAYPRKEGWADEYEALSLAGDAFYDRAVASAGGTLGDRDWQEAVEAFGTPGGSDA